MNIDKIKQQTFTDQKALTSIVENVIKLASKKVDSIEVGINKSTGINVNTRLGEVENIEFNNDGALGITVYQNQCKGYSSTNDLSPKAIEQAIDMAINIMKCTQSDPCSGLADKSLMASQPLDLDLFHPSDLNVEQAIKQSKEAEKAALSHQEISNSDGAYWHSHHGFYIYGNSHGMLQSYCASSHSLSCSVIAQSNGNMESDYAYTSSRDIHSLKSPEEVGNLAAQRAISHLNARTIDTMSVPVPVIFAPEIAVGLIGHLAGAISGSAIYKKSSFLLDQIGEQIFPDWLTILEDPHQLKGVGSAPFDNEGVVTAPKSIIQDGILQTYLLSSYSARKLSTPSKPLTTTANAGGIYNWLLSSNIAKPSFDELLKMMDKGIVVTSLMGQGVNGITGDYSRGATGFWVENGQIQYPIHEFTIASNLKDMYKKIIAVGSDTEQRTKIQSGSILIEEMSIAGK